MPFFTIGMGFTAKIARKKLDEKVAPYGGAAKTLEIGAYGSASYSKYFTNKTGLDIRPGPGVDVVGSVYDLPFSDNTFDMVLCMVVLEHLEDPPKAISEIKRVLKPNGRILASVPFMFPMHATPDDFWRFTKYGLKILFKDWDIEKIEAETNFNETFAVLLQRVGYQTKFRANKLMKVMLFSLAWFVEHMPRLVKTVYGGIDKKTEEPEAFASSFFLVARKKEL